MRALWLFVLLLVSATLASRTVYYSRALSPVPAHCTVYGTVATVCHLDDDQVAPEAGGHEGRDEPLIAPTESTKPTAAPGTEALAVSWGQDRVDQRKLPLDGLYTPDRTGNGANVWVVSSGIDTTVGEIAGRADNPFAATVPPADCNGQGTELAVTVAGATYGIAKSANVAGVKVLDCNGNGGTGSLVDGLAYILANPRSRSVVLIGVSYLGRNSAVEEAIEDLLAAGMTVVAEAGDQSTSACQFFPGSQEGVISVTSSTRSDKRYSFANYGSCVTMIAPGHEITTKTLGGTAVNRTRTRMAAAHVAGAAAQVLQGSPSFDGAQVLSNLMDRATLGWISNTDGTPNALLFVLQNSNPPQTTTGGTSSTTGGSSGAATLVANAMLVVCCVLLFL